MWQELYSHKNTVNITLVVIKSVKTIKSSSLITFTLDKSDNAVEIETNKDISINSVLIKFNIISLKLWERMKNKFNNLIKSVNQILDHINYEQDIEKTHLDFLH